MRTRRNRVWILATLFVLGTAAWMAAGWSPASASTVVTATDASQELSLLGGGDVASTGFNCNLVCVGQNPCSTSTCGEIDRRCACHLCSGQLKCTR